MRSPVAHGALRAVDCTAARDVPGVAGAWSAADLPDLPRFRTPCWPDSPRRTPSRAGSGRSS
ncbi:hypothetical protein ACQEV4_17000 [Streptomyces shenzhenensis]|uniref:hypothetical protein n=1 Tax=Streptomyces shenzhenensis TaxID=943815 RepID=UPI003D8FA682